MSREEELDRLASLASIEPSYRDAWERPHHISPETKRALLTAMGFDVRGPKGLRAGLRALEDAAWRRALDPVLVVRPDDLPPRIPILCVAGRTERGYRWTLVEEAGRVHRGRLRPADLPVIEARTIDGRHLERRLFDCPVVLPPGYHRFELSSHGPNASRAASMTLIVAPRRCYLPRALRGKNRAWAMAVQLYALRSRHNWGIGDFGDLGEFAVATAGLGAGAVGLNPLHALFLGNPAHASPYSPSTRLLLNALYIDVEAVPDYAECEEARERVHSPDFQNVLERLRSGALVDYVGVAARKLPVLELLYRSFRARHLDRAAKPGSPRARAFRRFQESGGRALELFALFEALDDHFRRKARAGRSWREWPLPYRDPASPQVARFAAEHRERIEFYQYLQWQADLQLEAVAKSCRRAGMPVGLSHDLAVGVDPNGAEAWARRHLFASGAALGAPPDVFNQKGQNWGLLPVHPLALREEGYRSFIATLRANMRHASALRVDHIMGFMRLFWVPEGASPIEGGYVRYPLDDLLGILALESHRNRCLVIGEDLGTVPEGFRERLRRWGILSHRLLYFERDENGEFLRPEDYPPLSLVAVSTHDLPTLPGYWLGHDVALRKKLDLFPSPEAVAEATRGRGRDRRSLLEALREKGLIAPAALEAKPRSRGLLPELVNAVYRYLALTPGRLLMVHFEDVLGQKEQVNLPGTTQEHPNWRRKMPLETDALARDPRVRALAAVLRRLRPAPDRLGKR